MRRKMSLNFYELSRMSSDENRHLRIIGDARGNDDSEFGWRDLTWGRHVNLVAPLKVIVSKEGVKRDFTIDIRAGVPILSLRAAEVVHSLADKEVEIIPAEIVGDPDKYYVVNVLSVVKCVDEERTKVVEKWTADSYRPDRIGEYKRLVGLVIRPEFALGHNLFRVWGSYSANVIASLKMKEELERAGVTGIGYGRVS